MGIQCDLRTGRLGSIRAHAALLAAAFSAIAARAVARQPSATDNDTETSRALYAEGMQALDPRAYAGVPSVNVGSWSLAASVGGA
jgi:hypothetical protein